MSKQQKIVASFGIETSDGMFVAHYSEKGLAKLEFPRTGMLEETTFATKATREWHKQASKAVWRVLQGQDAGEMPPLDLSSGTPFQKKVWSALKSIPAGKTDSYSNLAKAVGKPKGARALGSACGANPIPLLIPCHRVLPSDGGLGGFSGGLEWKEKLLHRESGSEVGQPHHGG